MLGARATTLQLPLLLALSLFSIQGTQGLQCYSCKDTGDRGCSMENAVPTQCPDNNDVCVQTLTTVNISFTSLQVLAKGCGSNASSESPIRRNREAIAIETEIEVCNTDLCNSRLFDAASFPLVNRTMNTSDVNTTVDCYGCIGIMQEHCSNLQSSNLTCDGNACAQGFFVIQLGNRVFLNVIFKDCGRWGPFAQLKLIGRAGLAVDFRRTVCTGALCNQEAVTTTAAMSTATPTTTTATPIGGSAVLSSSYLPLALLLAAVLVC